MAENTSYKRKERYTAEEKQQIMARLDEERRINQKIEADLARTKREYSDNEKSRILEKLNEKRLSKQKRAEIAEKRLKNKEVYTFGTKRYYKFLKMEREYFIQIDACEKLSSRPQIITLLYRTFDELKKKDVLIKIDPYSDKFFVSYDAVRVYFKTYALEDAHKK